MPVVSGRAQRVQDVKAALLMAELVFRDNLAKAKADVEALQATVKALQDAQADDCLP